LFPDERQRVIAEARKWLGTPWHHNARVLGAGVDCAQLLVAVYHAAGLIPDIDAGEYAPDWALHRSEERFLAMVSKYAVPVDEGVPGDVVMYRVGRAFSHGGIVVDERTIIHACRERREVCIDDVDAGLFNGRKVRFYSVRVD